MEKLIRYSFHKEFFNPVLNVFHALLFMIWSFNYAYFFIFVKYAKIVQYIGRGNNKNKQ